MPLARDQHNVARLCERDCATNRLRSIGNFHITIRSKAFFDLRDDRVRIFFARIIGRDDSVVSMSIHDFAHQRTLLPIAIAAAAKNDNQAMRFEFPQSFENIAERIRCVRVIDENLKLSFRRN